MVGVVFRAVLVAWGALLVDGTCVMHNNCNGHGECQSSTKTCSCYDGYGSATDVADYKSPDCSLRVCPSGKSWVDVPQSATSAHAETECSNKGTCNRGTGLCTCFSGFSGDSCQRMTCASTTSAECSGHGKCVSMKRAATMSAAFPLSAATTYTGAEATTTWDEDKIFGCVCDSSWAVGLASGERQKSEWFGPACSFKRCPSGDDPTTSIDESDCGGKTAEGGVGVGLSGNLCHNDCSNRGICDYTTGTCTCFTGYYSTNCALTSELAL